MGADDLFLIGVFATAGAGMGMLLWQLPIVGIALLVFLLTTGYLAYSED